MFNFFLFKFYLLGIVLIPDVDIFFHMSGESYYKAIRIALICMFLKCGIFDYFMSKKGFVGIVVTLAKYEKPLRLFQRFSIKTKVTLFKFLLNNE